MTKYVVFVPSGRLGNAIFRYFACVVLCRLFDRKYSMRLAKPFGSQVAFIKDQDFLDLIQGTKAPPEQDLWVMDDFFQLDVYLPYRDMILEFIENYSDPVVTDRMVVHDAKSMIKEDAEAPVYDFVVHIRLGEFYERPDFIPLRRIQDLVESVMPPQVCVVTEAPLDPYVLEFKGWLEDHGIEYKIEYNSLMKDYNIMRKARTLVCSMSTLCWVAAFLSPSWGVQQCFMPTYNFEGTDRHMSQFKTPSTRVKFY